MSHNIFLGAGISGFSGMKTSINLGNKSLILDKNRKPGGLTRSMYVDGFTFDYTGHFLHLAKNSSVGNLTGASDIGWKKFSRKAFCYVKGEITEAPFQYNLGDLSSSMKNLCWDGFQIAQNTLHNLNKLDNVNLESYFRRYFGDPITDFFLKPYNEKIFSTNLDTLSVEGIGRFFPGPDYDKVKAGLEMKSNSGQVAYNSFFYYPEVGGIQRLVDDLSAGIKSNYFDFDSLDPISRKIHSKEGECLNYLKLFPSIPLPHLLLKIKNLPESIINNFNRLSWSKVICFQIGVSGKLGYPLNEAHWIYIPDHNIPFFRVGCYSNIISSMAPYGCHSLYVEVSVDRHSEVDISVLQEKVLNSLNNLCWIERKNVELVISHVLDPAYVHFDHCWKDTTSTALSYLENYDIFPIGRYGLWDYVSMEDVILNARSRVNTLVGNK
jgi:protoporphyrinogen oxidase